MPVVPPTSGLCVEHPVRQHREGGRGGEGASSPKRLTVKPRVLFPSGGQVEMEASSLTTVRSFLSATGGPSVRQKEPHQEAAGAQGSLETELCPLVETSSRLTVFHVPCQCDWSPSRVSLLLAPCRRVTPCPPCFAECISKHGSPYKKNTDFITCVQSKSVSFL